MRARKNLIPILLVDDDEVDLENVKRIFKKQEFNNPLYIAKNGEEALDILQRGDIEIMPQIVLLDINMPKMNGLEFLKIVRQDPKFKHLMVYIFTTSCDEGDKTAAHELNVSGYVLKPLQFSDFSETITTLVKYWAIQELPENL